MAKTTDKIAPEQAWASAGQHAVDLTAYFARIAYDGPRDASLEVLRAIQSAHIAAIPFEAIDALLGDGVSLYPAAIEDKLLHRGRGGYCFEQNGLLHGVLERLGFDVSPRIARVLWGGVGERHPAAHAYGVAGRSCEGEMAGRCRLRLGRAV